MALSRLWCVRRALSFYSTWNENLQRKISIFVWSLNVVLSGHIFIFVDCRAWEMGKDSWSFGTRTPNIISTFYAVYVHNFLFLMTLFIYGWLGYELYRAKNFPDYLARQTLIAQFLINLPKWINAVNILYGSLECCLLNGIIPPMNLKLFWLLAQIGGTFYGINATIVVFVCFPKARKRFREVSRRLICGKVTPRAQIFSISDQFFNSTVR
ncbi:unnamed protein product, partial [Mesorhabditis belari]|uniref:Uncharacterized protein n=1 Tax=Mesorhabditis belari TaxID=2138241 RepID=A0AAF3F7G8_9BILA